MAEATVGEEDETDKAEVEKAVPWGASRTDGGEVEPDECFNCGK